MAQQSVTHDIFVTERTYPAPAERVFAAFSDSAKKRRWFAEDETHELDEFTMDFRVGGSERLRFRFKQGTQFEGVSIVNEASYQDIVPNQRVIMAYTMTLASRRISASLITFELLPVASGTRLICTHQGAFFEGADGPKIREMGWRHLLERLAMALS